MDDNKVNRSEGHLKKPWPRDILSGQTHMPWGWGEGSGGGGEEQSSLNKEEVTLKLIMSEWHMLCT